MDIKIVLGKAGTGKTTYILKQIENETQKRIYFLAFTHMAVENMRNRMKNIKDNYHFKTLHSFFRVNPSTGVVLGNSKSFDILIIDEISLIDKKLLKDCFKYILKNNKNKPIIYLSGDRFQLGSIIEKFTISENKLKKYSNLILDSDYNFDTRINVLKHMSGNCLSMNIIKKYVSEIKILTENHRSNNTINTLVNSVFNSKNLYYLSNYMIDLYTVVNLIHSENYVFIASSYSILEEIIEKLPYDYYIKQNMAGKNGFKKLYLKKNSMIYTTDNHNDYYNGELMEFIDYDINRNTISCKKKNGVEILIKPNQFGYLPVAPSNVYTVHKSQGLEFDNVIVCTDNLFLFPMLYTAITRAKNNIKFYSKTKQYNTGYDEFKLMNKMLTGSK